MEYITTVKNLKKTIDKYGVAIVTNILNENELETFRDGMFDALEHITKNFDVPIDRNKTETWRSFYNLYPMHSMLIQHWSLGHAQYVWNIRQNEKIVDCFSELWNVAPNELLTSFDGVSIHFPPEITGRGWYRSNDWLHTDQSYTRNDFECVQSFVTAYDIEEGDATLTFLEGSNHFHEDFKKNFNISCKDDWYKLNEKEYDFYLKKGCKRKNIVCPAGSIVFWDSRTIHCGKEPNKNRKKSKIRSVVYVCQTPRKLSINKNILKRIQAFEKLRISNHWPHKMKLFPKHPRTYGNILPNINELSYPKLTNLGRTLVGY